MTRATITGQMEDRNIYEKWY